MIKSLKAIIFEKLLYWHSKGVFLPITSLPSQLRLEFSLTKADKEEYNLSVNPFSQFFANLLVAAHNKRRK